MKRIKTITLNNFRSHENSVLDIGDLTSIIGPNDAGKSSVFRALETVLTNAPFTENALRYGTKEGWIRVTFYDGTWIERRRTGSKQKAILFDGTRTTEYQTIKDIDGIVSEFTGFKPIVLDKNARPESVQIIPIDAGQSFMISGISSEGVQRRIQRLMHGSGIETAKIQLEKEQRQLKAKADAEQKQYDNMCALVDAGNDPKWDMLAGALDALNAKREEVDDLLDNLSNVCEAEKLKGVSTFVTKCADKLSMARAELEAVASLSDQLKAVEDQKHTLLDCKQRIEQGLQAVSKINDDLKFQTNERARLQQLKEECEKLEMQEAIEREAKKQLEAASMHRNGAEPTLTAPLALVQDTVDCLVDFTDRDLAADIAKDWQDICHGF